MACALEDFNSWLGETLKQLNTDECIFGSYIQGILDGEETVEEKREALRDILSEIVENDEKISTLCSEILEKWQCHKPKEPPPAVFSSEEVDNKLVKLLESQSLLATKQKHYTAEEKKLREAILSQYSQLSDDEGDEEEVASAVKPVGDFKENIEKNTNFQTVQQAEKLKREQAKLESQKKKEKDKEDREKQKQLKEEKKEKRKTQKGERRR